MKHIRVAVIPDCPKCGKEMEGRFTRTDADEDHPLGKSVDGWWQCPDCGHQSEHFDYNPYDDPDLFTEEVVKV